MPQALGLAPLGTRLFAVGRRGSRGLLSVCRVDEATAALEVLETLGVGGAGCDPTAVLPLDLTPPSPSL